MQLEGSSAPWGEIQPCSHTRGSPPGLSCSKINKFHLHPPGNARKALRYVHRSPQENRDGEFAEQSLPMGVGKARSGTHSTKWHFGTLIFPFLTSSLHQPEKFVHFPLSSSSQRSPKSFFPLLLLTKNIPICLHLTLPWQLPPLASPYFLFFSRLSSWLVFFLSLTCLHHHYFSPLPIKNLISMQLFKLILFIIMFIFIYLFLLLFLLLFMLFLLHQGRQILQPDTETCPGNHSWDAPPWAEGDRATQTQIHSSGKNSWHSHSNCQSPADVCTTQTIKSSSDI